MQQAARNPTLTGYFEKGQHMDEKKIIRDAIQTFGKENQLVVACEEMSELQKEICKQLRGCGNIWNIAEEIADVEIMLMQIKEMNNCYNLVDTYRLIKLERLERRIKAKRGERT